MSNPTLRNMTAIYLLKEDYYFFADLRKEVNTELTSNEGVLKWFELEQISFM